MYPLCIGPLWYCPSTPHPHPHLCCKVYIKMSLNNPFGKAFHQGWPTIDNRHLLQADTYMYMYREWTLTCSLGFKDIPTLKVDTWPILTLFQAQVTNTYTSMHSLLTMMWINLSWNRQCLTSVLLWTNTLESRWCVRLLTPSMPAWLQRANIHTVLADISCWTQALVGIKFLLACAIVRTRIWQAVAWHLPFTARCCVVAITWIDVDLCTSYRNPYRHKGIVSENTCSFLLQQLPIKQQVVKVPELLSV